jgi:hypothetical protein
MEKNLYVVVMNDLMLIQQDVMDHHDLDDQKLLISQYQLLNQTIGYQKEGRNES